jgi:ABC-type glycerol-3-phosphate transport system substrate-binding protein
LRVACPGEPVAAMVRSHARTWASWQLAHVEVRSYDPRRGPKKMDEADVWVIRPAELPHWAAAGRLLPAPASLRATDSGYEWLGLLPVYREQLLLWDRKTYAVPLLGEAPLCCYRADLFADEKRNDAYRTFLGKRGRFARELRAPASWEEFADIAEFFQKHPPAGKAAPSLPALPADDGALDRLFYTVAAPFARRAVREEENVAPDEVFSFHYDLKDGTPRISTPGFVAALELLRRLQACRPAEPAAVPAKAFAAGQAVLCLTDAPALVEFQNSPAVRDRFGVCPVPGAEYYYPFRGAEKVRSKEESNRVPYLGGAGWLAVVPRTAKHPEAAWSLLANLSGPAVSMQAALEPRWGGGPIRMEQLGRESWGAFELDKQRSAALKEALGRTLQQHGLKNPVLCLRTPDQAAHRAALVAELRRALAGKVDEKEALKRVAKRWEEIDAKKGKERVLKEYRLSLGLLAR